MSDNNKYEAPPGPPPNFPQQPPQAHQDAGPYYPSNSPLPDMQNQVATYPPAQYEYGQYQTQPYYQYNGPPGPMDYQQPGPQQGYFADNRGYGYQQPYQSGGGAAAEGICAGLLGALACCCCLELLF